MKLYHSPKRGFSQYNNKSHSFCKYLHYLYRYKFLDLQITIALSYTPLLHNPRGWGKERLLTL